MSPTSRILLVEDEQAHAELIRRAFESRPQFELKHASCLREAEAELRSEPLHLVICDYRLPDGTGTQLIRTKNGTHPPPVVVMTSQGSEAVAVEVLKRGAIDYVVKSPETFADMPHVADRALRQWGHIVERDEAQEQLRERERQLRLVTDAVPALIAYLDRRRRFQFVNAAFERTFGRPREWFVGRPMRSVLGAEIYDDVLEAHCDAVLASQDVAFEAWLPMGSPEKRFMRQEFVPHRADDGGVLGFYALLTDLTEVKRAEEERLKLQKAAAAQERLAAVGTTAAMFAHEVANPLHTMYLHAQLVESTLSEGDAVQCRADLGVIKDEIARLNALLLEFRTLSRGAVLQLEPVELGPLLDALVTLHLQEPRVQVIREIQADAPPIRASADKLKQVFLNLCKNAVEAMPDGGRLTLRVRVDDDMLVVELEDTGPGIPPDLDVFEAFKSTKAAGTGLGLPVARQIVIAHGGTIEHEPAAAGTLFRVRLPIAGPTE
ncbi:MAG: response regulator [Myxococcales bacterium]|nr:response regulator [Myxococcales bacterium]